MNTWIAAPDELSQTRVDAIGGKAAGLLRLQAIDVPVPPWFVIPACQIADRPWRNTSDLEDVAHILMRPPFDGIAVRSSAAGEDQDDLSHAGVFETLFVDAVDALPDAIDHVVASAQGEGAAAYGATGSGISVILQARVPAVVSGIAFSADPAAANPSEVCVEMVNGAGHQLADGTHQPTRVRTAYSDGAIHHIASGADGPRDPSAEMLASLHSLLRRIEDHLACAVDVEWVWDGKQVWVVQARPITALHPDTSLQPDEPCTSWFFDQRFNEPIRPFTQDTLLPLIAGIALGDALRMRGARVPDTLLHFYAGQAYAPCRIYATMLDGAPAWFLSTDLRQALRAPGSNDTPRFNPVRTLRYAWHAAANVWAHRSDVCRNLRAWDHFSEALIPRLQEISRMPVDTRSQWLDRWAAYDDLTRRFLNIHRWSILWADYWYRGYTLTKRAMPRMLRESLDKQLHADTHLLTVTANAALQGALANPTPERVSKFLRDYGHRSPSLDYAEPTWRELWESGTLQARVRPSQSATQEAVKERGQGWQSRLLYPLRRFLELREEQRFAWERILAAQRAMVLRAGQWLTEHRGLPEASQVFFLTRGELLAARFDLAEVPTERIAERMHAHRLYRRMDTPPVIGTDVPAPEVEEDVLQGIGASPGVATGTVHVIHPHDDYRLDHPEDHILVARALDPAWTPHLLRARGVILERGGLLSHAAVIAREYGTPLIVGLDNAIALLPAGTSVTMDGTRGVVTRE